MPAKPLRLCALVAALLAPFLTTAAVTQEQGQPNIIVILADDLGVETLGTYGGTSYETPELDRIAAEGMRFENGHSQPLCTPTRVKLMTGLHNYRNYREFMYLDPADVTFAHVLAQAGYRTVISGKWQLTNNLYVVHEGASPQQAGFDEHRLWQLRREGRGSRYWGPTLVTNDRKETWGEDVFGPDLTNDFVLEAIDEHAAADPASREPLFIYYPMALPHDPFVTTPHHPDAESNQERFAAMVAYMDHLVGRVRAKLVEHELERDTLLLFVGDNGTSTRITSVRDGREVPGGKGRSLQTGSHVPYLAWWPGTIPAGQVNETLVDVGDVFPTLVEAAGAGLPPGLDVDGESLLPMLKGGPALSRDALFIHYESRWYAGPPARYAFDERFKRYDDGHLFDHADDPDEQSPLDPASLGPEDATRVEAIDSLLASKPGAIRTAGAWRPPTPGVNRWTPPAHRPKNLLFIADDMTFSDAGAQANHQVHTP
ncbi:MAG: sulfatase-like hydrolase/transferase, partial [Holophagales bacterium]|nr:sulfatase-like hydrolase/transferase [Holophagales bacterium]